MSRKRSELGRIEFSSRSSLCSCAWFSHHGAGSPSESRKMLGGQGICDMLMRCCSLAFCEVSPHEADIPFVVSDRFCFFPSLCAERKFSAAQAGRDYPGGRAGQGGALSAFLGTNVRFRPRHSVSAGKLSKRFARSGSGDGFQVRPFPRDFSRRSRSVRRRRGETSLQFFLRRSDLRWPAASRRAALRRTELHAQEARRGK